MTFSYRHYIRTILKIFCDHESVLQNRMLKYFSCVLAHRYLENDNDNDNERNKGHFEQWFKQC
jgi:hypothetical protein